MDMNQSIGQQGKNEHSELLKTIHAVHDLAKFCRAGDETRKDAMLKLLEHAELLCLCLEDDLGEAQRNKAAA